MFGDVDSFMRRGIIIVEIVNSDNGMSFIEKSIEKV